MASKNASGIHYAQLRKRRRLWYISPEGFRELRHSCLLSRQRAADYLGVSLRTIRHWDAGRNRVPWSVVRLLRLVRAGELGGLDDAWEGWTINRAGLRSPCGRVYTLQNLRHWWLVIEQARFWRDGYDAASRPSAGVSLPAAVPVADGDPLLISTPGRSADSPSACLVDAASPTPRRTAFDRPTEERASSAAAGKRLRRPPAAEAARDASCTHGGSVREWLSAEPTASGCTLPRDVNLTSDCRLNGAETCSKSLISGFTPVPPGIRSVALGPNANRGQNPFPLDPL